ncbi:ankyrin repeat protein, putative [Trichomonas vaginalis G3]|uniref:Ankyrin repeat protein, putative n=1 Tax=Trichomonas vaginalis (strain ATCC PRA-98 / G3) TaxID=412133 RepID=A2ECX5_TRIV3|nr:cyclin-dependent kinase inhibitor 2C-related family [Trichomonas vaginalis G3]EAY09520.1 ankyrin repeat protein, putative [Trichomonas vaginalis G3]KAI5512981.1 cyclin-dependent kinase inhibitor 2C-related family [Trichomonas vaginalis G3]|eukprot:XP_001321743.1 ankyrin repeat protein [Trichomonas vaginalis G3]
MSDNVIGQNEEFMKAYYKLYHISPSDSLEEILEMINTVLVKNFKVPFSQIIVSIIHAIKYNYRSINLYIKIFNQFCMMHSIEKSLIDLLFPDIWNSDKLILDDNATKIICCCTLFPLEESLHYYTMFDQLEKIIYYSISHDLNDINKLFLTPHFGISRILDLSAFYGSSNIFFYLLSNFKHEITQNTPQYSFIGNNTDIIKECLKHKDPDNVCLEYAIESHNNDFIEDLIRYESIDLSTFDFTNVIVSQNLKFIQILANKDVNSIIPWCASIPQSIDILKSKDNEIDYNKQYRDGRNLLHFAAQSNCIDILEFLSSKRDFFMGKINAKDNNLLTPLHYALNNYFEESSEFLISEGADINAKDGNGKSILYFALERRMNKIAYILISIGADINSKSNDEKSLIHIAAKYNNQEVLEFLIKHYTDINTMYKDGITALHVAAEHNSIESAEILIKSGAEINAKDKYGFTALHVAAEHNSKETAEILIKFGADINVTNKNKETALHIAAEYNSKDTAELLIKSGVDINAKEEYGRNAICYAANNSSTETAELLIKSGADINSKTQEGYSAIHFSARRHSIEMVELLIKYGADINAKNIYEETVLHEAAKCDSVETGEFFIKKGVNVRTYSKSGMSPLLYASMRGFKDFVSLLLKYGEDINSKDPKGRTVLHHAVLYDDDDSMAKLAISYGADVNARDNNGKTPLQYCKMLKHHALVKTLISHGAYSRINGNGRNNCQDHALELN